MYCARFSRAGAESGRQLMDELRSDVLIVGARCAGSPLATHLARHGLSVRVVDQAEFPSDAPSTHFMEVEGVRALQRLGVLSALHATGAPAIHQGKMVIGPVDLSCALRSREDDPAHVLCVRRTVLDQTLVNAARAAGAEVHTSVRVMGLIEDQGRVVGVRASNAAGKELRFRAKLVVGADGQHSTVARLTGARAYNVTANERFFTWGYYAGAPRTTPHEAHFFRHGGDVYVGCPSNDGLFTLVLSKPLDQERAFAANLEGSFDAAVRAFDGAARLVEGARRIERPKMFRRWQGFFREAAGPGWALVGDAGHFKDPTPGQGISDALRQAERLAELIVEGLGGRTPLEAALAQWAAWRDEDAAEFYWWAYELGKAAPLSPLVLEVLRELSEELSTRQDFCDLFMHRKRPSEVFTTARVARAVVRLAGSKRLSWPAALGSAWAAMRDQRERRRLSRRPRFAAAQAGA
jgi:2-polyprenyl-6-methoxyphenol hydroxylase-like FAD-dependent oxidoreductase